MNQLLAMQAFVRLAEARSFTRVADQLSLPRSTVSKLIADLEHHLGTKLVQRTTRAAVLTAEGEDYYALISGPVAELDEADLKLRGRRDDVRGRLRVDVPSSFANLFLIERLADFRQRYPEVVLELGISDRTVDIVGEGVDCAIRAGTLNDTTLIARRLLDAPLALCAAPDYLRRRGVPRTIDELRGHELAGYFVAATSRPMPVIIETAAGREELLDFSVLANESTGHINMMLAGLGIGQEILPIMQPHIDAGRLVPVLDGLRQPVISYHLLYPSMRHKSARLNAFIDWITAQVAAIRR